MRSGLNDRCEVHLSVSQPPSGDISVAVCNKCPQKKFPLSKTFSWHFPKLSLGLYQQLFFEMIWTDAAWRR